MGSAADASEARLVAYVESATRALGMRTERIPFDTAARGYCCAAMAQWKISEHEGPTIRGHKIAIDGASAVLQSALSDIIGV